MIPVVVPKFLKHLFPELIWDYTSKEKDVFLTFDDGPELPITQDVLACLLKYNAKATFFCLGEKAEKHPEILTQIREMGHSVGNHGYAHISGYKSNLKTYHDNFTKSAKLLNTQIYRPPYGRITPKQIRTILPQSRIIMWSIMSKDYKKNISEKKCIRNVLKNVFPGAIIVFHDSIKTSGILLKVLPVVLKTLQEEGYKFKTLY